MEQKFQEPGAGISRFEYMLLKHFIKPLWIKNSDLSFAIENLIEGQNQLIEMTLSIPKNDLTKKIIVRRPWFIEDSSRNWSVALLFRHLAIVNDSIAKAIVKTTAKQLNILASDLPSNKERVAAVKPEIERNTPETIVEFKNSVLNLISEANKTKLDELKRFTIPHPWIGELTLLQWIWFAGLHQTIHKKHLEKITKHLN